MVARSIPSSLAGVLGELELERPAVVTVELINELGARAGLRLAAREAVRRLQRLGWLLPLRVRGAWELAPADRAGALPAGDPFIELQALSAVRPDIRTGVGFDSAAFLRGLATRQAMPEVLVFDEGSPAIRALSDFRRVDLTLSDEAYGTHMGLRVQTINGLLAAISIRPDGFHDWPGIGQWLAKATQEADTDTIRRLLAGRPAAAWHRAAYLLRSGGDQRACDALLAASPPGRGPFYLGPRRRGGVFDATTKIVDTVIARYASVGIGA